MKKKRLSKWRKTDICSPQKLEADGADEKSRWWGFKAQAVSLLPLSACACVCVFLAVPVNQVRRLGRAASHSAANRPETCMLHLQSGGWRLSSAVKPYPMDAEDNITLEVRALEAARGQKVGRHSPLAEREWTCATASFEARKYAESHLQFIKTWIAPSSPGNLHFNIEHRQHPCSLQFRGTHRRPALYLQFMLFHCSKYDLS